jgi:hypothetical protein
MLLMMIMIMMVIVILHGDEIRSSVEKDRWRRPEDWERRVCYRLCDSLDPISPISDSMFLFSRRAAIRQQKRWKQERNMGRQNSIYSTGSTGTY